MRKYYVVGAMSGTSLDGLDIAFCEFSVKDNELRAFSILDAHTFSYSEEEKNMLSLMKASAQELAQADFAFGRKIGISVKAFLEERGLQADMVASHGHTIFHQPALGFTTQIGNGAAISAMIGLPVVSDFRSMDVALEGQGAPLVPIGDLLLFQEYHYCLNLGGIANISVKKEGSIFAYDICPANMPLNLLVNQIGLEFDRNGDIARSGKVHNELLAKLDSLTFYQQPFPKSLGKEWVDTEFLPLIESFDIPLKDKLATVCEHISIQIANEIAQSPSHNAKLLVTGGGAFNSHLVTLIQDKLRSKCEVVVPDKQLVNFKEALIFAFLGLLRVQNKPNALKSVTGAQADNIGGALYGDFSRLPF